jgi:hypothetical protein
MRKRYMANGWFWRPVKGMASVQSAGSSHHTGTGGMSVIYRTYRLKARV